MTAPSIAEVEVTFHAPHEGGRGVPLVLVPRNYRPHFRVGDGDYLGVVFVAGPTEALNPGASFNCSVEFAYESGVNYDALSVGAQFRIMEGARCVGTGRVLRRA
jgi:translation elongation factor EF-Tu-like GTPase